mgnify:CR=1 FL=1
MIFEYRDAGRTVVFYNNQVAYPMRNPNGTLKRKANGDQMFFFKEQTLEDAPNHWEWSLEDGHRNLYYINHKDWSRRIVRVNFDYVTPPIIQSMLKEKEITWSDANAVDRYRRNETGYRHTIREERIPLVTDWSVIYDGKSVYDFMEDRPKTPYADLVSMVKNEGGYIDEDGIIHKKPRSSN